MLVTMIEINALFDKFAMVSNESKNAIYIEQENRKIVIMQNRVVTLTLNEAQRTIKMKDFGVFNKKVSVTSEVVIKFNPSLLFLVKRHFHKTHLLRNVH